MKIFFNNIIIFTTIALAVISCGNSGKKALLPNVSGKAGEVLVVINKSDWEGVLGKDVRKNLKQDCPFLPQKEPLFTVAYVQPNQFSQMFKIHRNILDFQIDPQITKNAVIYKQDVWAAPQSVIQITAQTADSAMTVFENHRNEILSFIEQAEMDRIIANAKKFEEIALADSVSSMVNGKMHFPTGYKLKKKTKDFIWIADEKQYVNQGIFIYRYPAEKEDNFTVSNIIKHRNEIMKANVPGMFENTYMTTSEFCTPQVSFKKYRKLNFAETRGFWEVHKDYMGGPFVSHSFYSLDGKYIIVLESFVYAPKYDKRQYLRQVEALLYSFEWDKKEK